MALDGTFVRQTLHPFLLSLYVFSKYVWTSIRGGEIAQSLESGYISVQIYTYFTLIGQCGRGGEIAQSLESLSTNQAIRVRARLDPLVLERWNSITVLLTRSHQCRRLVQKRLSMCYYVCVIMHVKDP